MADLCPKCGAPLSEPMDTKSGKRLQRCSNSSWNPQTKKNEGCDYVKWLEVPPQELEEKCPKCGAPLILQTTRFGKKMKKCSKGGWDKTTKQATGCDYVQWINGTSEPLEEDCPECGAKLVLYTTAAGKKMKKCSTAGWDKETKTATGCKYVQWLKASDYGSPDSGGEEFLPPDPS
ncbi:topoisomerase DNA-binding C4 zinc finger domain-containing protein [Patescibacteria group bacterium]|nr:topoisomerase DNA-binding C4 zinc finger domain-containing protein [Patescibacteria group bacterium]